MFHQPIVLWFHINNNRLRHRYLCHTTETEGIALLDSQCCYLQQRTIIEIFFFFQQYLSDLTKEEQLTKVRILRISIPAWYVQFPYFLNFDRAFETCNLSCDGMHGIPSQTYLYLLFFVFLAVSEALQLC